MLQLKPDENKFVHFPVLPIKLGKVTVAITADSFVGRQTFKKTIKVRVRSFNYYFLTVLSNTGGVILLLTASFVDVTSE